MEVTITKCQEKIIDSENKINELLSKNDYGFLVTNNTPDIFSGEPMIYAYSKDDKVIYMKYISSDKDSFETLNKNQTHLRLIKLVGNTQHKINYDVVTTIGQISSVVKMKERNQAINNLKKKYSDDYIDCMISTSEDKENSHILKLNIQDIVYNNTNVA